MARESWMVPAAKGLDITHADLRIATVNIGRATYGAFRYQDVLEMEYAEVKSLTAQLEDKNG